jgi:hypothetical protein
MHNQMLLNLESLYGGIWDQIMDALAAPTIA